MSGQRAIDFAHEKRRGSFRHRAWFRRRMPNYLTISISSTSNTSVA
jgi:hypothetical protein